MISFLRSTQSPQFASNLLKVLSRTECLKSWTGCKATLSSESLKDLTSHRKQCYRIHTEHSRQQSCKSDRNMSRGWNKIWDQELFSGVQEFFCTHLVYLSNKPAEGASPFSTQKFKTILLLCISKSKTCYGIKTEKGRSLNDVSLFLTEKGERKPWYRIDGKQWSKLFHF